MASEISKSQINAIVAEYNDGATLRQLGERHGLYAVRIQRILKANGVEAKAGAAANHIAY